MTNESLGRRIRRLREERKLRQAELAEALNTTQPAVSGWENGAIPDLENLKALSSFFGLTLDDLINGEEPDSSSATADSDDSGDGPREAAS